MKTRKELTDKFKEACEKLGPDVATVALLGIAVELLSDIRELLTYPDSVLKYCSPVPPDWSSEDSNSFCDTVEAARAKDE